MSRMNTLSHRVLQAIGLAGVLLAVGCSGGDNPVASESAEPVVTAAAKAAQDGDVDCSRTGQLRSEVARLRGIAERFPSLAESYGPRIDALREELATLQQACGIEEIDGERPDRPEGEVDGEVADDQDRLQEARESCRRVAQRKRQVEQLESIIERFPAQAGLQARRLEQLRADIAAADQRCADAGLTPEDVARDDERREREEREAREERETREDRGEGQGDAAERPENLPESCQRELRLKGEIERLRGIAERFPSLAEAYGERLRALRADLDAAGSACATDAPDRERPDRERPDGERPDGERPEGERPDEDVTRPDREGEDVASCRRIEPMQAQIARLEGLVERFPTLERTYAPRIEAMREQLRELMAACGDAPPVDDDRGDDGADEGGDASAEEEGDAAEDTTDSADETAADEDEGDSEGSDDADESGETADPGDEASEEGSGAEGDDSSDEEEGADDAEASDGEAPPEGTDSGDEDASTDAEPNGDETS